MLCTKMSLDGVKRQILDKIGVEDEAAADFVVNLFKESHSIAKFEDSLHEMGAEFDPEFTSKIYNELYAIMNPQRVASSSSNDKPKAEEVPIKPEVESSDVLSLPNDKNIIKQEDDYDGEHLLSQWSDFKKEEQQGGAAIPRSRSRSPVRRVKNEYRDRKDIDTKLDKELVFGKVYGGRVINITNFGAFIALYGVVGHLSGMVHISAISTSRINHPSDVLKKNQDVFVKFNGLNNNGKISLTMKDVDQITGELIDFNKNERGRKLNVTTVNDFKRRLTSPEKWEIRQLIASGAISAKDYPELDDNYVDEMNSRLSKDSNDNDSNETDNEVDIELKHSVPPFLAGLNIEPQKLMPAKVAKLPEGSLNRAAMSGSALAKERREMKIKELKKKLENDAKMKALKNSKEDVVVNSNVEGPGGDDDVEGEIGSVEWQKLRNSNKNISFGKRTSMTIKQQRESLPVYKMRLKLVETIKNNQFVVIVGETGSGKTTQLTQYLDEEGFSSNGIIGCTQPRRVAATSVAKRVAEEKGVQLGREVGYTIRFEDKTSPFTRIKYMTDGMLQREALMDPTMSKYSVIMLDEAHERTIATDVLFALLKQAAKSRPDLKIIVTSATLDSDKFSSYFNNCPIIEIPGRTFPVEILYTKEPESDYLAAVLDSIIHIHVSEPKGDILVFLTGQEEIETSIQVLEERIKNLGSTVEELIILPVYSALPSEMQSRIFEPTPVGSRKVILATNIAETSLTIDGIFYVIDPGFAKINAYDPKLGMDSLVVKPISQAQANQRSGRAGRTGPGKCFRLYTELAYKNEMLPNTIPEIQRQNLSNTILMLKAIGINDLLNFEFMDPPPRDSILLSLNELYYLKAIDDDSRITTIGRNLVNIPADPTISKTLIESIHYKCSDEMITIFAMLSTPNIFYRPKQEQEKADKKKAKFHHPHGDHLTYLNVYNAWVNSSYSKAWCQQNYIQERSLRRVQDIKNQLLQIFKKFKYPIISCGNNTNAIRKALCSGFFKNIAKRDPQEGYKTLAEETQVYIHPSSSVRNNPQYVVYNSILNTTKEYLVHVTIIEPKWLIEISPEFFQINKDEKGRKINDKIVPLFNKFAKGQNEWRLHQPAEEIKKSRFRA